MHPPPAPQYHRPPPYPLALDWARITHRLAGQERYPLSHAQWLSLPVFKTLRWCLAFGLAHTSGPSPSAPQRASGTSVHHAWLLAHRYLTDNHLFSIRSPIPSLPLLCCFSPTPVMCVRDSFLSSPHLLFKLFFSNFLLLLSPFLFILERRRETGASLRSL